MSKPLFNILLSGEKEWIVAEKTETFIHVNDTETRMDIDIRISLDDDVPPITFYNEEVLQSKIKSKLPVAKLSLNPDCKVLCTTIKCNPCCALNYCLPSEKIEISLYHLLQKLIISDLCIDVNVCNVRNLIVQNDENLQDVNGQIFPFGPIPLVDSNFFIGSKERFFVKIGERCG